MSSDRRRVLMSGGAIAVFAVVMWAMWPSSPAPSASTPQQTSGAQPGAPRTPPPVAPVKLDSLGSERQQPADSNRNPFRYQPKAPPPPRPATTTPVVDKEPPKPVVPPGPPPPPPIPLKFIGILERANGVKWAVLSDGKTPMHGRDGDIVMGQYRIVKIGTESIEMTYVDGRGRQVIRLTGQ